MLLKVQCGCVVAVKDFDTELMAQCPKHKQQEIDREQEEFQRELRCTD